MKFVLAAATAILLLVAASPATAALAVGDPAPDFSTRGVQGGTPMTVHLSELLKQGPVVIFFIPYVFNSGSAAEGREFAANIDKFHAAGASVVGMSRDSVDALARFSTEECAGKFPMAWANLDTVTGFDVNDNANFATRTTYVIDPGGKVAFVQDDEDHRGHVNYTLAFVQGMKKQQVPP